MDGFDLVAHEVIELGRIECRRVGVSRAEQARRTMRSVNAVTPTSGGGSA